MTPYCLLAIIVCFAVGFIFGKAVGKAEESKRWL
jgi:hypothetical protein